MATQALIALGGNLGEREANLSRAWEMLGQKSGVRTCRISRFYETEAVTLSPEIVQPKYLNAAGLLETDLPPIELLRRMQAVEQKLGRVREERWGARTIDLDLLLFGDLVVQSEELTVPHPLMHERRFVLEPAAEIVPEMRYPVCGKTVLQLLADIKNA